MRIRAIALALPLLAGIACRTGSAARGDRTARTASPAETAPPASASAGTGASEAGQPPAGAPTSAETGSRRAADQVVAGVISGVSAQSLTILAGDGSNKTLLLGPETTFRVDGQEARQADLQEGQPVRASFRTAHGDDLAVEVRAGEGVRPSGGLDR